MKKLLFWTFFILFAGTGLTLLAERVSSIYHGQQHRQESIAYQTRIQHGLQSQIDRIVADNNTLATQLAAQPESFNNPADSRLLQELRLEAPLISISLSRNFKIFHVIPQEDNEAIANMDYLLYPENMRSIRRAFLSGETAISEPYALQQTSRPGMTIRNPVLLPDGQSGMVSTAVDISSLLQKAGHQPDRFQLLIELRHPHYNSDPMVQGEREIYKQLPAGVTVSLPEEAVWEIRSLSLTSEHQNFRLRQDLIRLGGASLTTLLLLFCLRRQGLLSNLLSSKHKKITLRLALLLLTVIPIVVLTLLFELLYYSSVQQVSRQQLHQHGEALLQRTSSQIRAILNTPRQAVFNSELFHQGVLKTDKPEDILVFFATQLRIQPYLSFLAVADTDGDFHAASRPPNGTDRTLRMQWATRETGREMRIHWVNDNNRPSKNFTRGNPHYDPRDSVWYQQAQKNLSMQWYPPHLYLTLDSKQQYAGLGIGISAPLFDHNNIFVGIISADIALSQLEDMLASQYDSSRQAILVLSETDGTLLATSGRDRLYRSTNKEQIQRLTMADSENPAIRAMAGEVAPDDFPLIQVGSQPHLLVRQDISLPDGPELRLTIAIPADGQDTLASMIWRDALYAGWLVLLFSSLVVIFVTHWISQPLQSLERWAAQLRRGHWSIPLPRKSPIRELASLTRSLDSMASQLKAHTAELEYQVSLRTEELSRANRLLEQQSITDGLTGLANRRYLDQQSTLLWQQAQRHGNSFALLMIDIDWFKNYNDHYGHLQGDVALRRVASVLDRYARRPGDLVARYGGEEFVLVLSDTPAEVAGKIADHILAAISAEEVEHIRSPLGHITVSIGLAVCSKVQPGMQFEHLLQCADSALYRAKQKGRNRVDTSCPDMPECCPET